MRRVNLILLLLAAAGCASPPVHWTSTGGDWIASGSAWQPGDAGSDSFLVSRQRYGDVEVSVEFMPDAEVNSGVFVRCQDPADITPFNCYEANIWDQHPRQEFRTGAIVARAFPPQVSVDTIGRWNLMEVRAAGPVIEVRVNGELTARLVDADPAPGHIVLQHSGDGQIRFRRLQVSVLQ